MENIEVIDIFDGSISEYEAFPVKDRGSAYRRKKTFLKGKRRFDTIYSKGFIPNPEAESIIRGMLRKTNVIKVFHEKDISRFGTNPGTIKRKESAKNKLDEYCKECS